MRLVRIVFVAALFLMPITTASHAVDATSPTEGVLPLRSAISAPSGARALCETYAWACASATSTAPVGAAQIEMVVKINRAANRQIRPVSDEQQYRVAEKWALPTARGGDCEDYALFKKAKLIEAGISPDRLLLASVLDRRGGSHAVLVLRADGADLVLDNLTNSVKRWDKTGYTFLRMQDPRDPQSWVATMAGGHMTRASS